MSSQFGTLFKVTTFGESHGHSVGCVVDGCPAGVKLSVKDVQEFLNRRKPAQNEYVSARSEEDKVEIVSGMENNITLGSPICIIVRNSCFKKEDYKDIKKIFRPGHADYTTFKKYGIRPSSGGGRASARETIGRVAAAAVAKQYINQLLPKLEIVGWVARIADVSADEVDPDTITLADIEKSPIRCPDLFSERMMKHIIKEAKLFGDSVGGIVKCVIKNAPVGLGEPVFNKLCAELAKAMLSIPAAVSYEKGTGMSSTFLRGSKNNDAMVIDNKGNITTKTNRAGGIVGGISNGMPIVFSVGFKPTSTIFVEQETVDTQGKKVLFKPNQGRHDSCVLPRAVPIVEAMAWLVIAEYYLHQLKQFNNNC